MRRLRIPALALFVAACGAAREADPVPATEVKCNGAAVLCERRYDEVVNLTAHNAMSNADEGFWFAPNQDHDIARQLADGVRGLSLDVHPHPDDAGDPLTCHGTCAGGSKLLGLTFETVRLFLESQTDAVVTILYESAGVDDATVAAVLRQAGLTPFLYTQTTDATWPTLGAMIAAGKRLVVFSQDGAGVADAVLPMWAYTWDTPYAAETIGDFSCEVGRGAHTNGIMQINHFITAPLAGRYWAEQANTRDVLMDHVTACRDRWGKWPTFLWVDWYATGDALRVVRELNGIP